MLEVVAKLPEWLNEYVDRNTGTLSQVTNAYRANLRQGTVGVKTRSMVNATGKKPYKQKKTGNARRGSDVSPICVGGGVAHGPKARDYRQSMPEKMVSTALGIALAKSVKSGKVLFGVTAVKSGKTKDAWLQLKSKCGKVGNTVVCFKEFDEVTVRAFKNLRGVRLMPLSQLNALDILTARHVILEADALDSLKAKIIKD